MLSKILFHYEKVKVLVSTKKIFQPSCDSATKLFWFKNILRIVIHFVCKEHVVDSSEIEMDCGLVFLLNERVEPGVVSSNFASLLTFSIETDLLQRDTCTR